MSKGTLTVSWLNEHASSIDLRRTVDDRLASRIVARAEWLPEPERSMVVSVFGSGLSAGRVAKLRSMEPRVARRMVSKAAGRLLDPRAVYVAARAADWPVARAQVGRAIFHDGCTLRETARRLDLTLYTVRVHRDAIEGMFESESFRSRKESPTSGVDRRWQ